MKDRISELFFFLYMGDGFALFVLWLALTGCVDGVTRLFDRG